MISLHFSHLNNMHNILTRQDDILIRPHEILNRPADILILPHDLMFCDIYVNKRLLRFILVIGELELNISIR